MSSGLNLAQQEAVNFLHGPCLVLAGAGSGKTRVITHKIGRLIQTGVDAKKILAITFTNKAATEMRERAKQLVGKPAKEVVICTFHALGVRLLRQYGESVGLKPQFSILDSDDVLGLLKDAGGSTDVKAARAWQWQISLWKNMGLNAAQAEAQAQDDNERITARIMARYEERLTAFQSVDFDDLIGLPLKMLQKDEQIAAQARSAVSHLLVDEYQDTNATQYELLKILVGGHEPQKSRFTAVGDDDQSIYGWRGATLDNLKRLPVEFPNLKVIKLEQNYRSTGAILRAANNVIGPNPKLFPKNLWSDLGEGEPVRIVDADNEEHEAERAVARIQSLRAGDATTQGPQFKEWKDFCVLYRANHQARVLEQALRKAQIPYKVSGGQSFFDRAEIKDLCAWLRLLVNNDDDPAFVRAVTTPKRGIGHQTLQSLGTFASRYKLSLFEALFSNSLGTALSSKAVGGLHEFGRYLNDLEYRARHTTGAEDARVLLTDWLKDIGYEKHLYEGEDNEKVAAARWTNVMDFCDWMAARCGGQIDDTAGVSLANEKKSLLEVAQTISLLSTLNEREGEQNVVTLSTLHASKGLEWPHVILAGVTEGMLPFRMDDETESGESLALRLQEERRLMYVGITRAQRTLSVSWTKRKKKGREMVNAKPSRFIAEMALDKATVKEDPREKLKALRAEFAKRASSDEAAKQSVVMAAACALGLSTWMGLPQPAHAQAVAPLQLQQCASLPDMQALLCFRQLATSALSSTPSEALLTTTTVPLSAAASSLPAEAPSTAIKDKEPLRSGCKNRQSDELARFWDLETQTDCNTYVMRGYKPNTLMWSISDSVNRQPSSSAASRTAVSVTDYRPAEVQLSLSVRTKIAKEIIRSADPELQDSLWFGYSQQSRWQLFHGGLSRPFRTTDHEPELIYIHPHNITLPFAPSWKWRYSGLSVNHQSNGQSLPLSRSWNRVILMAGFEKHRQFTLQTKLWQRMPEKAIDDDNPDINEYIGRAEIAGQWFINPQHQLGLTLRHPLHRQRGGSARLDWFKTLSNENTSALKLHMQLFHGYGESLIDYNQARTTLGVGLSLVDW
jgi:ATP-dependent DNA helicase Rep